MSYSKKLFIKSALLLSGIFIIILIFTLTNTYFSLRNTEKYGVLVLFLVGFFCYPLVEKIVDWFDYLSWPKIEKELKRFKSSKRGMNGENEVNSWLDEIVGRDNYLKNVRFDGRKFDIDNIIISSKGVIALEVKNLSDKIIFEDGECFYEKDGRKINLDPEKDPRFELRKHAHILRCYLDDNGFEKVPINKALVFSNGNVSWVGKPEFYIARDKESLGVFIEGLNIDSACTKETCEKIRSLLER